MQGAASLENVSRESSSELADVDIRRATAQEPNDALALIEEYYEAVNVVARDDRDALLGHLSDPKSGVWIAYCGGVAAGCILYRPLPQLSAQPFGGVVRDSSIGSAGEIKRLYVRPDYRGRGIASLLLHALEQFAISRGISWLYLDTKDDLHQAIAFYKRHEYMRCGRYNGNPQATIFMRKALSSPIVVRDFQAGDEEAFRTLNEAWIARYFYLEDKDRETLREPHRYILSPGGEILMAIRNGERVGCCALLALPDGSFEVAKMAVAESEQGRGIGRKLLEHVIDYAKARSIHRLYLETNSSLANAIHLYESVGFRRLPQERIHKSPYERADVYMEMILG
ncbi:MAG: GNAT family N-acetyltransferase [Bryobacteraceae bacterium]